MAGLLSSVGLAVMLEALMHVRGRRAVFLGIMVMVTVITADSPVADEYLFDSTHHYKGFRQDVPVSSGSSPPASQTTAFGSPDSPGVLPSIPEPDHADSMLFQLGRVAYKNSKSFTPSDRLAEKPQPLSTPSLSSSKPVLRSNPQSEAPTKLSTDWKLARINSAKQSSSVSPLPARSQLQPQSNISTTFNISSSAFTRSTTTQLSLTSEQKVLDAPLSMLNKQQDGASEETVTTMTSLRDQPVKTPKLDFTDSQSDEPYILGHALLDPNPPVNAPRKIQDVSELIPSSVPLQQNKPAHDIYMLPNPEEILAPSYYVPFITPHPTSPASEPTEVSPEDFYPTNTMEVDWGSGDYLETMSFLSSEGDEYSLVTKVPSDTYDLEDIYTESYDTSFPSRVGISLSSMNPLHISPSSSLVTPYSTFFPLKSIHPSHLSSTIHYTLEPTPTIHSDIAETSDIDWLDTFSIQPTDVLLPDMNSLEYYTTQLTKENTVSESGAEQRGNVTVVSISTTDITPTSSFTNDTKSALDESSGDVSGLDPNDETALTTEESPQLVNASEPLLHPSIVTTPFFDPSSSIWVSQVYSKGLSAATPIISLSSSASTEALLPGSTALLPDDVMSSSLTDVYWFVTESFHTIHSTPVFSATAAFSPVPTEHPANTTAGTTDVSSQDITITTELTVNNTSVPPVMVADQGITEDTPATLTSIPDRSEVNTIFAETTTTATTATTHQATTGTTATTEASTSVKITSGKTPTTAPTSRHYSCNVDKPAYLVKIGFPSGATVGYAKTQIRDILKWEFNKSVELQVVTPPPKFVFRVVSGPVVYTAISVINALRRSGRRFLSVSPNWTTPDNKYQVHTVLQFVPSHLDVRFCNFSENIEKGLTMAFAEVRRRSKASTNFTVHIVNITMAHKYQEQRLVRNPVDITFTVSTSRGYLMGSEVSNALMKLTMVEFSYYMGFPVLQIAEPFHYPALNTSQFLRSSWVKTVLLGVQDEKVGERTFQANMERRVALLLGEAMGLVRRVKRATTIGNNSVQVVSTSRLVGLDQPLEIVYFVEGPSGQRMPAVKTANLLNSLDVQKAAIVLGYRVQGILAQPVEKVASTSSDNENTNMWIVIGVVIPLLVVVIIISILYWKLCRTDKLEFQPDAMTSIQQRQKLQAPSVKGFDFAKLHLGQQSKDDVMVIQESGPPGPGPGPLPVSIKDGFSPSENGEIPTPISKTSSIKASRSGRRRERISPSDGDSMVSDHSSERESTKESLRAHATPSDSKQSRKVPINVLNGKNRIGPPPLNGTTEQLSSASIFEHVDRMSRATDTSRRLPNKIQLIAMQPMAVPPLHSPPFNGKQTDTNQINKEIQVALRHKSEIEHHRNKIRLRAKRKGHYDFPAMDENSGIGDPKDQDRIYHKAQIQIDKILEPNAQMPSIFMDPKKGGRGRRSPKERMKEQLNGDKDHLITDDTDAAYRKCPGVNNVAYVSDLDQGPGSPHRSPSPTDDVFLGPPSSPPGHAPPPPPYMPPQPSIAEARQQMHSLLDDAFALVSPTSQGTTAGITLPGVNTNPPSSSPPGHGPRPWGASYPGLGPFPGRFSELGMSPSAVQGLVSRQGHGSNYLPPGETAGHAEQLQPDSLYSSRGLYTDELPSSARPRPVGGTTGAQLHHLTQVGLASRMNGYPAGVRAPPGQNGGIGWSSYHDDNFSRTEPEKDAMPRSVIREPSAPPAHLDTGVSYLSAPPSMDTAPPTHSSASLIKAIREELLRLSQKQAAVSSYHS